MAPLNDDLGDAAQTTDAERQSFPAADATAQNPNTFVRTVTNLTPARRSKHFLNTQTIL
jgi:hypothetical protein